LGPREYRDKLVLEEVGEATDQALHKGEHV
jgi:hypothetical protein